jgi:cytidine deaminase
MRCINNHHTAHKPCHVCRYIAEQTKAVEVQPHTESETVKLHNHLIEKFKNTEDEYLLKHLERN